MEKLTTKTGPDTEESTRSAPPDTLVDPLAPPVEDGRTDPREPLAADMLVAAEDAVAILEGYTEQWTELLPAITVIASDPVHAGQAAIIVDEGNRFSAIARGRLVEAQALLSQGGTPAEQVAAREEALDVLRATLREGQETFARLQAYGAATGDEKVADALKGLGSRSMEAYTDAFVSHTALERRRIDIESVEKDLPVVERLRRALMSADAPE